MFRMTTTTTTTYPDLKPWFDNESDIYDELPTEDFGYDE